MLRFTLLGLAALLACIVVFGCSMAHVHSTHHDTVSNVETFMNAR